VHLAPDAGLPEGARVSREAGGRPGSFIADDTEAFGDVCCGRGDSAAGVTFCDYSPDEPGVVDASYMSVSTPDWIALTSGLPVLEKTLAASPFLSEAAESVEKCAAVCDLRGCASFAFQTCPTAIWDFKCVFYGDLPNASMPLPTSPAPGVVLPWSVGLPPRSRAKFKGARVRAAPDAVELSEAGGYAGSFELSLGAHPLRGAVWIEPRVDDGLGLNVTFSPPRVVLYDAAAPARVAVSAAGVDRRVLVTVKLDVTTCDDAFGHEVPDVYLDARAPSSSSSKRAVRRLKRRLTTAAIAVAAAVGLLLLVWCVAAVARFVAKKRKLEADRATQVREQVAAAVERVEDFQA